MKVAHLVPSFYPATVYGGPIQSVLRLCQTLQELGAEIRVLTTNANGPGRTLDVDTSREVSVEGLKVRYCRKWIRDDISLDFFRCLSDYNAWCNVAHITAIYNFTTPASLLAARLADKPAVVSPRGALQRWSGSRRVGIKGAWDGVCSKLAPHRLSFHATSDEERDSCLQAYHGASAFIAPNGVDLPEGVMKNDPDPDVIKLLFLGRIDPKKGLENLIEAMAILQGSGAGKKYQLVIAGSGDAAYEASIRELVSRMMLGNVIGFTGFVEGSAKSELLSSADIAIFPSHTENFGMVVAEALSHATPVIVSTGMPWGRVNEIGCGWQIANSPESLAASIQSLPLNRLRSMGEAGRQWMKNEFSWKARAQQVFDAYREIAKQ